MKILILTYFHPDHYPPTINAIDQLSLRCSRVDVVCRNLSDANWNYNKNVYIHLIGNYKTIHDSKKSNPTSKIIDYVKFLIKINSLLAKEKPDAILCYDSIVLALMYLLSMFKLRKKTKIWYHNHDKSDQKMYSFPSVGWFADCIEKKMFKRISYFSLPANERKTLFSLNEFKGKYFFIPNYPSKYFFKKFYNEKTIHNTDLITIYYQGVIARNHGFEEFVEILSKTICNKTLNLVLKGHISPAYKVELEELGKQYNVLDKIRFLPFSDYASSPLLIAKAHIGLGIKYGKSISNNTGGTASNKIYEYAAMGLPAFVYHSKSYKNALQNEEWIAFTDLSENSIRNELERILTSYNELSKQAHKAFLNKFNFEDVFLPVIKEIEKDLDTIR